ncbi:MAG: hypothetical protein C4526_11065 [Nitrospiraceae bacterium]|nr:MAG: hypothetical protein C4526_11065 [Nitrospiraceae bacterium]
MDIRRKKRHSHIYIELKIRINGVWEPVKALDWNEDGFNFYMNRAVDADSVMFKKGAAQFSGVIVWKRFIRDDYGVIEMALNRFLFEELEKLDPGSDTYRRIVRLIRVQERPEEKKKLLTALKGVSVVEDAELTAEKYKVENPLFRYGVKVVSEEWNRIVSYAFEASSVVRTLDNISKELSRMADEMP